MKITITYLFLLISFSANAQFFQGFGITLGADRSNQRWQIDSTHYNANQKAMYRFNGSVFVEYINHPYFRMITEVQYFMEGSKSKVLNARVPTNYICINNFFKMRQELYDVTPYMLFGPKVNILNNAGIGGFKPVHFTGYIGVGMEFLYSKPWIWFIEAGYEHDINKALKVPDFAVTNKAIVLRVGIKYEPHKKSSCRTGGFRMETPKSKD